MSISLNDLVISSPFDNVFKQIAGFEGLSRDISKVSIIDTPLVPLQLYKLDDEVFILSSFYLYRDNPDDLLKAVTNLNIMGASALAIKTGLYINTVPDSVIQYCDQHSFPLFITIDEAMPFRKLISMINEQINDYSSDIIGSVFYSFINGQSQNALSQFISTSFSNDFVCMSVGRKVLFKSQSNKHISNIELESQASAFLESITEDTKGLIDINKSGLYGIPCYIRNLLEAVIVFYSDIYPIPAQVHRNVLQLHNFALIQIMEMVILEAGRSKANDSLIKDLLLNSYSSESLAKLKFVAHGLSAHPFYRIIICSNILQNENAAFFTSKNLLSLVERSIISMFPGSICISLSDRVIGIIPIKENSKFFTNLSFSMAMQSILDSFQKLPTLKIIYSELQTVYANSSNVYQRLNTYVNNISDNDSLNNIIIKDFDDTSIALSLIETHQDLIVFDKIINPIQKYDAQYNYSLMDTLRACIIANSLEDAAKNLHIHSSTLRYRLSKIADLTGYDYFNANDRSLLYIASTLYSISNHSL